MVLAAAIGAVAILGLSGLAVARDGERHRHGEDTGTIASFDTGTGVLAIQLNGGGDTVSGLVSRRTKIRCEDEHSPDVSSRTFRRESGSNSGPGSGSDDNGRGEAEPGDDHGGQGNEPGDDHGGAVEPGDDRGGRGPSGHDDDGAGANCTASDLVAGTVVHEAELDLRNGEAVWDEVELND
jgi:hypothetical protein